MKYKNFAKIIFILGFFSLLFVLGKPKKVEAPKIEDKNQAQTQNPSSSIKWAKKDNKIVISYDDIVYVENEQGYTEAFSQKDWNHNLEWEAFEADFTKNDSTYSEIISIKNSPREGHVYISMRNESVFSRISHAAQINTSYSLYDFDIFSNSGGALLQFHPRIPSIHSFSPDGEKMLVDLYICTECDGGNPHQIVLALYKQDHNHQQKFLGQTNTYQFKWNKDGTFTYQPEPEFCSDYTKYGSWEESMKCYNDNKLPPVTTNL